MSGGQVELVAEFPEVIDNTVLKDWRACPQRFFQKRVRGLRVEDGGVGIDAHFGSAFAHGVEVARKVYYVEGRNEHDALSEAVAAAVTAYQTETPPLGRSRKTIVNLVDALHYYFNVWPLGADSLRPIEEGIESAFTKPLGLVHPVTGKELKYVARMDMAARDNFGNFVAVDEKTTSQFSDAWLAQWDIDPQMTGYIWILRDWQLEGMPHAQVRGIAIGAAVTHTLVPIFRSEHQLQVWERQLFADVADMLDVWRVWQDTQDADVWDRRLGTNCVQYGRACEFMQMCNSPNADDIARANFEVRRWSPLCGNG